MANHKEIATRWAERATGKTTKSALGSGASRGNVFERDGKVYSYGMHFEMGRYVRPKRGTPFFLLNGDAYSNTTTRHQSYVRDAVKATGQPSAIIPHTALQRAGIALDSIVAVDVEPEVNETIPHTVNVPGLAELGERAASGALGWDDSNARQFIGGRDVLTGNDGPQGVLSAKRDLIHEGTRYSVTALKRGYDYGLRTERDCGACEGTGRIPTAGGGSVLCGNPACQDGKAWAYGGYVDYDSPRVSYYRNGSALRHVEGDTFTYDTYRHWLGGVVFHADVEERVWKTCANHGESLTTFPSTGASEWCAACDGLVTRDDDGNVNPARPERVTVKRNAWFVSGWDENETRPLYFLAELPAKTWQLRPNATGWDEVFAINRPKTYSEAIASLMPREVKRIAPSLVKRQGDIFAVPCGELDGPPAIAAKYAERGAVVPLDGTSRHVVTELVTCADGGEERVYARGTMRHVGGDHARLTLGNVWHRLYRNTVPMPHVEGDKRNVREVRAWTIAGRVD